MPLDGRRARAERNRSQMVDAARQCFLDQGYVATTIEQIASESGVAPQTVYNAFRSKHALLAAVLDATIAGDDDPLPVARRPWLDEIRTTANGVDALSLLVDGAVPILERTAAVYRVMREAAAEPEVGPLLAANHRGRRADQFQLVEAMAGHLRTDLEPGEAADITYALVNEDVFTLLTVDCGWSAERFREWLLATLVDQLLPR